MYNEKTAALEFSQLYYFNTLFIRTETAYTTATTSSGIPVVQTARYSNDIFWHSRVANRTLQKRHLLGY